MLTSVNEKIFTLEKDLTKANTTSEKINQEKDKLMEEKKTL